MINILIDKFTPCIEEVKTSKIVNTQYNKINVSRSLARQLKTERWNFDWNATKGDVYQLTLDSNRLIQGLISLEDRKDHVYVHLVESNPQNIGKDKIYNGVGAHLFAIAVEKSFELGYDGFIRFMPKTALTNHYKKELGAVMLPNGSMGMDTDASSALVEKYIKKE